MVVSTTEALPGRKITAVLGIVRGNTVRSKHVGSDFLAGLKSIVGGEVKAYTNLLEAARDEALDRMREEAQQLGADGVVGVRFVTSEVSTGMAEILAYGTAVTLAASR